MAPFSEGRAPAGSRPQSFLPAVGGLRGRVRVPGDKSVSHRAVLLGAVSEGPVRVSGFLRSADTMATVGAVRALQVTVEEVGPEALVVHGRGWDGLREPEDVIDVMNAGTLIRLFPGLVASLPFMCILTGDASIRRRPMARVLAPLAAMGATVHGRDGDRLPPVVIRGGVLHGRAHVMTVASAQVKSCLILAGLRADGESTISEPAPTRDHTERMIRYGGARVEREGDPVGAGVVHVWPLRTPALSIHSVEVPGDFSSAAFLVVAALLSEGSEVTVEGVGLNPTRTGLIDVLQAMGAGLGVEPLAGGAEPMGAITARSRELEAVDIDGRLVPLMIDELPIWALAAAKARGVSRLRDARELRVKESDRLTATADLLRALGVRVEEYEDGLDIHGDPRGWDAGTVQARGDHRLAMVGAVAGLASSAGVEVDDTGCIDVSFPSFADTVESLSR
jgi:3-phosphoshikimate 1-carboxyvinyltransferase